MKLPRGGHQAVAVVGGSMVLVAGGLGSGNGSAQAERYDVASGRWTRTGPADHYRYDVTLTVGGGGKALTTGGFRSRAGQMIATPQLYDRRTDQWTSEPTRWAGRGSTATYLGDGQVLLTGGQVLVEEDVDFYVWTTRDDARVLTAPSPWPDLTPGVTFRAAAAPGSSCTPVATWTSSVRCDLDPLAAGAGRLAVALTSRRADATRPLSGSILTYTDIDYSNNEVGFQGPYPRPDVRLLPDGVSGPPVGDGVYDGSGRNQTLQVTVPRGRSANVLFGVGNDGTGTDRVTLTGTSGSAAVQAIYRVGQDVITVSP